MRRSWRKPISSSSDQRSNHSSNFTKRSMDNFSHRGPLAPRPCDSTAKSLRRLALKSIQTFQRTSEVNRVLVSKAISLNSLEALTASRVGNIVCVNVYQETRAMTHGQSAAEINLADILLSSPCKFQASWAPNSPCEPSGMLIIDEGVTLVVSK